MRFLLCALLVAFGFTASAGQRPRPTTQNDQAVGPSPACTNSTTRAGGCQEYARVDKPGAAADTTGLQEAVTAACAANETLSLPAGTYLASPITIPCRLNIEGNGIGNTIIKAQANVSGCLLCLNVTGNALLQDATWRGFTIDDSDAPNAVGVQVNSSVGMQFFNPGHIKVIGGLGGFDFEWAAGVFADNLFLFGQSGTGSFGIKYNGDNGANSSFSNIAVQSIAGTLDAGFEYVRTTTTDTGGLTLQNVQVNANGAPFNYGFRFHKDSAGAVGIFLFANQIVADNGSGSGALCSFENVSNVRMIDSWCNGTEALGAVQISGGQDLTFVGNWIDPGPGGKAFSFLNAPLRIITSRDTINQGTAYNFGTGGDPVGTHFDDILPTASITNSPSTFSVAHTEPSYREPTTFMTDGSAGASSAGVTLQDITSGDKFYIRRGSTSLEFLDNSFAPVMRLHDGGLVEVVNTFQVTSGAIKLPNLPSTAPAAGSKQLWYDPADGNRVKYVP